MPAWDDLIFYNDLLMLAVSVVGLKLGEKLGKTKWFAKLSLIQVIASIVCVSAVYIPHKMYTFDLSDVAYILSVALSAAVFVCCVIARRQLKKEEV